MLLLKNNFDVDVFFKEIAKGALLMLDYDGTLAPFVKERQEAYPYSGVKDRLIVLNKLKSTRTVIVSGRRLSELEILLDMSPSLELWGSHGLERKLPDGKKVDFKVDARLSEGLGKGVFVCQSNTKSEHCEIKPYAVAFHWRQMDEKEKLDGLKSIEPLWKHICADYDLDIHHFDGGIELRPKGHDKGDVIRKLLNEIHVDLSIAYLGDDTTDEEAFAALGDRGLKVLVREQLRPTLADVYLIPPQELLSFLDRWILASHEVAYG